MHKTKQWNEYSKHLMNTAMNIMQMQSEYTMNVAQTRDKISLYCGTERFQCMRELFQMTLRHAAQRQPQFAAAQA